MNFLRIPKFAAAKTSSLALVTLPKPLHPTLAELQRHPKPTSVRKILAMTATPGGPLIRPDDIGGKSAWQLLLRENKLELVFDDFAIAPGTTLTTENRAQTVKAKVPSPYVTAGLTAAWVYCGTGPLEHLELSRKQGLRGFIPRTEATTTWTSVGLDKVTARIAGLRLTDENRTIADVAARHPTKVALPWILRLVENGADLKAARKALEHRYRVVGREQARKTLTKAAALIG